LQNEGLNKSLHRVVHDYIPKHVLSTKNKAKTWKYGYDPKYDLVIISKDGTLGEVYEIQNLKIEPKDWSAQVSQSESSKTHQEK